jgi:GNAT superfamily N-acetyltransferase
MAPSGLIWFLGLPILLFLRMIFSPNPAGNFSVSRLCDVPAFAPVLAAAHAQEWGHLYANWNREVALADFEMEKSNMDLPTTWVIHHPSDTLMGSISLVNDDLPSAPDLNPWLASLFVFPKFRGRGLGKLLVQQALDFLHQRKYPHAYLFTEDQVAFFSNFGFVIVGKTKANGHLVTVLKWTNPQTPQG